VRLVYGSSYAGAAGPLLILLVAFPLRGLTTLADMVTTAYGRLRLPVSANWVAAGIDVGLAALLIPSLAASGAAIASVAAQLVYLVAMLTYVRRLVAYDRLGAALVRAAIASAIAGAVAWTCLDVVGGAPGLLLGLLAFGAAFVLLAAALRIVPAPDADWIEEEVRNRFGARVARVCRRCSSHA
jgi:O-antigen/teichoic acid export membrane protein